MDITNKDKIKNIVNLANEYKKYLELNKLNESSKIEEYELNAFIKGKADAFTECLDILSK